MSTLHKGVLNSLVIALNNSLAHGHDHLIEETLLTLTNTGDILASKILIRLLNLFRLTFGLQSFHLIFSSLHSIDDMLLIFSILHHEILHSSDYTISNAIDKLFLTKLTLHFVSIIGHNLITNSIAIRIHSINGLENSTMSRLNVLGQFTQELSLTTMLQIIEHTRCFTILMDKRSADSSQISRISSSKKLSIQRLIDLGHSSNCNIIDSCIQKLTLDSLREVSILLLHSSTTHTSFHNRLLFFKGLLSLLISNNLSSFSILLKFIIKASSSLE